MKKILNNDDVQLFLVVIITIMIGMIVGPIIQENENKEGCEDLHCEICCGSMETEDEVKIPLSDEETVENYMKLENIEGTYKMIDSDEDDDFIGFFVYDSEGEITHIIDINRTVYNTRY